MLHFWFHPTPKNSFPHPQSHNMSFLLSPLFSIRNSKELSLQETLWSHYHTTYKPHHDGDLEAANYTSIFHKEKKSRRKWLRRSLLKIFFSIEFWFEHVVIKDTVLRILFLLVNSIINYWKISACNSNSLALALRKKFISNLIIFLILWSIEKNG